MPSLSALGKLVTRSCARLAMLCLRILGAIFSSLTLAAVFGIFAGDDRLVLDVWSAGRHLVTGGRHIAHDKITSTYRAALTSLHHDL